MPANCVRSSSRSLGKRQSFHEIHRRTSTARVASRLVRRTAGAMSATELYPQTFVHGRCLGSTLFLILLERVDWRHRGLAKLQNVRRRVAPGLVEGVGAETGDTRASWGRYLRRRQLPLCMGMSLRGQSVLVTNSSESACMQPTPAIASTHSVDDEPDVGQNAEDERNNHDCHIRSLAAARRWHERDPASPTCSKLDSLGQNVEVTARLIQCKSTNGGHDSADNQVLQGNVPVPLIEL